MFISELSTIHCNDSFSSDESSDSGADENIKPNRCFLVYENELKALVKRCPKCGEKVDPTLIEESASVDGSQLCLKIQCFAGCKVTWKPEMKFIKGLGNLDLPSVHVWIVSLLASINMSAANILDMLTSP